MDPLDFHQGTVLGFDFGEKRIGVAVGELSVQTAHPLTTLTQEATAARMEAIAQLVQEWQPRFLMVGCPVHADGTPHEMTRLSQKFARRLRARFPDRIVGMVDERHTSLWAEAALDQLGLNRKKQRPVLDQVAALALLQGFLNTPQTAFIALAPHESTH